MSAAGVIATSDPRASEVGARVLGRGGNAADAAVAAALTLMVVEPHACGVGGDAFVLHRRDGSSGPSALDGSGAIPDALAAEADDLSFEPIPLYGPRTITVPGAVRLLADFLEQEGSTTFAEAADPARRLAADGFVVRPTLAAAAARNLDRISADPVLRGLYLRSDGSPVDVGDRVRNPQLADALDRLGSVGVSDLYAGELAASIVAACRAAESPLGEADLVQHLTEPMTPVSTEFAGATVWELPEPTQGPAVLVALDALSRGDRYDTDALIQATLIGMKSAGIDLQTMAPETGGRGDTTYIACMDADGLAVSLITSVFSDFGAGIGVAELGSPLQNRAAGTTLIGQRPRRGKPPHTTIPAMVTRGDRTEHVLGVVGGYMQAQGQIQVLVNLLVHGMSAQAAIDAPRFRVLPGGLLAAEERHLLAAVDPAVTGRDPGAGAFGGCQVASRTSRRLEVGSDRRRNGSALRATRDR